MRDSGFIKLPSERTLYEYSHANPATEGIQDNVLKRLSEDVRGCKSDFFTYYSLKMDEMYVFQNVVYNKGSGEIVGYASLESVEEEIRHLEMELDNKTQEGTRPVAKTMLTYMAKGESGGLVVTSRTLIREVPGSIPGASYLGGGIVVVLHHQANAGVVPIGPQPGVVAYPCKPSDLVARYRGWFEVVGLAAHDQ